MEIFVQRDDNRLGSFSEEVIIAKIADGSILATDYFWHRGMSDWKVISSKWANQPQSKTTAPDYNAIDEFKGKGLKLASPGKRFLAGLIDVAILLVPTFLADLILPIVGGIIIGGIYSAALMSNQQYRGTVGMKSLNIIIVTEAGDTVDATKAALRYIVSYASLIVFAIGFIVMFFTEKRQTWHDMAVSTLVVEV
jgi:hypothetical protein